MQHADKGRGSELAGPHLRIALVQARFNAAITDRMAAVCREELARLGVDEGDITHLTVPGALEVPVALKQLAAVEDFDALIALGCVIRGETYHFEVVASESAAGLMRVALDHGLPVVNGILTVDTDEQAQARVAEKGRDAARVAVEMANLGYALAEDGGDNEEGA